MVGNSNATKYKTLVIFYFRFICSNYNQAYLWSLILSMCNELTRLSEGQDRPLEVRVTIALSKTCSVFLCVIEQAIVDNAREGPNCLKDASV